MHVQVAHHLGIQPGGLVFKLVQAAPVEFKQPGRGEADRIGAALLRHQQGHLADAVCVTPVRLLELDRGSLDQLENRSPRLYAKMMRNLNVHIAHRLDLATGLVRALQ